MGRGGQNLTQVLTVTLWWLLWGVHIGDQDRSRGIRAEATAPFRWEMMGLDHDGGRYQWPNSTEHTLCAGPWGHVSDWDTPCPPPQGTHSPLGASNTQLGSYSMSEQRCETHRHRRGPRGASPNIGWGGESYQKSG